MSPVRISPEVPIHISPTKKGVLDTYPTTEVSIVAGQVFVLPVGRTFNYIVRVDGIAGAPGGIVETERLTPGHTPDYIILTTPQDTELFRELGVSAVKIDSVLYEATNP